MPGIGPAAIAGTDTSAETAAQPAGTPVPAATKFRGVLAEVLAPLRGVSLPAAPPSAPFKPGSPLPAGAAPAEAAPVGVAPPAPVAASPASHPPMSARAKEPSSSRPARHAPKPAATPAAAVLPVPPQPPLPIPPAPIVTAATRAAAAASPSSPPSARPALPGNAVPSVASSVPIPVSPAAAPSPQAGAPGHAAAPLHAAGHGQAAPAPAPSAAAVAASPVVSLAAPMPMPMPTQAPQSVASSTPAASRTTAAAPSPAAQLAPVMLRIAADPAGAPQLTVHLAPAELGVVQVQLVRAHDGSAQVAVTAERPETLQLLQRDAPALHHALDAAGLPQASRSVTFQLAPPAASTGTGGLDTSAGGTARERRDKPRAPRRSAQAAAPLAAIAGWSRAGIDVTA